MTKKIIPFEINLKSSQRAGFTFQPRPQILTNDANSAELNFRISDTLSAELSGSTATVLLYMKDGSFFQNTDVTLVNNTFIYTLKPNQAKHKGIAQAQLVVKKGAVENASPLMEFEIVGGLETKPIVEREIQDWTSLTAEAKAFVDQIEGFTLDQFVETKMGEELANLEVNYATRLTGLETNDASLAAQLAQTRSRMNGLAINVLYPPAPFAPSVPDANYYDEVNFKYYKDEAMTIPATDNKPMFQALVDYLFQNGGGTILVPPGEYAFRSRVRWESKVSLVGASKAATKLYAEGEIFSLIDGTHTGRASDGSSADNPDVWFEDCTFSDFLIDNKGLSYKEPSVGGKGLFILYMKRGVFRDLVLLNTIGTALGCDFLDDTLIENVFTYRAGRNSIATGGYGGNSGIGIGVDALAKEPVVVSNCFTYNSGNYGVFVESQSSTAPHRSKYAKVINCHSQGNKYGFGNKGAGSTQFIGCTAVENRYGIHLSEGSSGDKVIGCTIEDNEVDGLFIASDYAGEAIISNNSIIGNGGRGIYMFDAGGSVRKNISINDNIITRNGLQGVFLIGNARNLLIASNTVFNNGQVGTPSNQLRGIMLSNSIDGVSVIGNLIYDDQDVRTQSVAIQIGSNVTNYLIDGNNLKGYEGTAALTDGNKTGVVTKNNIGIDREISGTITLADGVSADYINHYLGQPAKKISLTPLGDAKVWVIANSEINRIRIQRDVTAGSLDVMYSISI